MNHLGDRVEKLFSDQAKSPAMTGEVINPSAHPEPSSSKGGASLVSGSAHLEPSLSGATSGPIGHREEIHHRGARFGVVYTTLDPPLVTGAMNHTKSSSDVLNYDGSVPSDWHARALLSAAMPDLPFPKFDGTNPKLWIKNCETIFEVYLVDPRLWIRYSTMHLTGSAALWFQTVQSTLKTMSWADFVATVSAKFDRDEHNQLMRQFFHIRQLTNVHEYIENFCDIVHQLLAHDPNFPSSVITNRFIDGLKREIKAVIMVHRPQDLDSASSLALLQEEALLDQPNSSHRRGDANTMYKRSYSDGARPSVIPTGSAPKYSPSPGDDKKTLDSTRSRQGDDKLSALKNYRKAKGLCFKCGEKWSPGHKCQTVSLHAMEEVWEFLTDD